MEGDRGGSSHRSLGVFPKLFSLRFSHWTENREGVLMDGDGALEIAKKQAAETIRCYG